MIVEVPLALYALPGAPSAADVRSILAGAYAGEPFVTVADGEETERTTTLDPEALNGTNRMKLYVFGGRDQARLIAVLDNLGKGASGAAVQNLNLMIGAPETTGL
jgi:N-acetyl-gamma-glutamyl-phosphate reductase